MSTTNKVREEIANAFIASLQEGKLPWKACWEKARPENMISHHRYRGINAMMLSLYAQKKGYTDPRWCTFKQAAEKGWKIRKGEKAAPVEYWAYYDKEQRKLLDWKEAEKLLRDKDYADKNLVLRNRVFMVFNAQQMDGVPELENQPGTNIDVIRQQRDTLLKNMDLKYREAGDAAYYDPIADTVTLPPEKSFWDTYAYACTFLHECGHATGHPTRLSREMAGGFGSENYAKEELRAEIASAFTAQALGLQLTDEQLKSHMDLHKAYIQGWASALSNAPDELFRAIKDAEKISDYLIEKGEFQQAITASKEVSRLPDPAPAVPAQKISLDARIAAAQQRISQMPASPPLVPKLPQPER